MPVTTTLVLLQLRAIETELPLQDELNILQLRHVLNAAQDVQMEANRLHFRFNGQDTELYLVHNMLVRSPGTVIYLTELEEILFEENDELLTLCYTKNNEQKTCRALTHMQK